MTQGRVYVTVGGGKDLLQIVYFDTDNKRVKTVDLDHTHKGLNEHTHHGYYHNKNDGKKGATGLSDKERKLVNNIRKLWYNHIGK